MSPRWRAAALALGLLCAHWLAACDPHRVERGGPFVLADSLRRQGRVRESVLRFRELRDSLAGTNDTAGYWRAQLWWSDALMRLGKMDSASAGLDRAMVLAGADSGRVAWTHHIRSLLLHRLGRFDEAFAEAKRTQAMADALRDWRLEWAALNAEGTILSLQGRYAEALEANRRSLALQQVHGGTPADLANVLNEMALGYRHLGRFTQAERAYDSALAFYRKVRNPEGQGRVLYNYSAVHLALGERDAAERMLRESEALIEQTGEARAIAFVAGALAELYIGGEEPQRARPYVERAIEINRAAKLPYGEAVSLANLGILELKSGELSTADAHLRQALAIADEHRYGRQRATSRIALARLALALRDTAAARRWAAQASAIADSLGDPEVQYDALDVSGAAREAAGDPRAAESYEQAIALLESWRGRLALGDLRMGVSAPRRSAYEGAIRTLLARGRSEEALAIADRARARLLLDLMIDHKGSAFSRSHADSLRQALRERYEARENAAASARPVIDREIARLTASVDSVDGDSRAPIASAAALREAIVTPDRVLLEYFWGDSAVYGWAVSGGEIRAARLGRADSLAASVAFLRAAVERSTPGVDWRAASTRMYHELVAPLARSLPTSVLVVPDGPLAYLPIEVLIPAHGAAPLAATTRIWYGPSAAVLLSLAARPEEHSWQRSALVVGDPRVLAERAEDSEGNVLRRDSLASLPYAAEEARGIYDLFRDGGSDLLLGRAATTTRWLGTDPGRYRYLHFATHARVDERVPDRTHLVLADGDLDLTVIRGLRLRSELVTLSACETALGRWVSGEGVIGLPYAFLVAGASSAVVTLWRIGDRSASEFMRDFYVRVRAGTPSAEALRLTRQERIVQGGGEMHPSHWAAFVLVGAPTK